MKQGQEAQYAKSYNLSVDALGRGYDTKNETEIRNMTMGRRLSHATAAPDLDAFFLGEMASFLSTWPFGMDQHILASFPFSPMTVVALIFFIEIEYRYLYKQWAKVIIEITRLPF